MIHDQMLRLVLKRQLKADVTDLSLIHADHQVQRWQGAIDQQSVIVERRTQGANQAAVVGDILQHHTLTSSLLPVVRYAGPTMWVTHTPPQAPGTVNERMIALAKLQRQLMPYNGVVFGRLHPPGQPAQQRAEALMERSKQMFPDNRTLQREVTDLAERLSERPRFEVVTAGVHGQQVLTDWSQAAVRPAPWVWADMDPDQTLTAFELVELWATEPDDDHELLAESYTDDLMARALQGQGPMPRLSVVMGLPAYDLCAALEQQTNDR